MPNDDIVCRVASGEAVAEVVLRTPDVVAFLDHRPVFKGHVLVCPTRHIADLTALPEELLLPLFAAARAVATAMGPAFGAQGSFVGINNVVSQSVPHLHVHVVPRSRGDGLRGFFWPRTTYPAGEAARYASRLRDVLGAAG